MKSSFDLYSKPNPSHFNLGIKLNDLNTYAILETYGRHCYISKQFTAKNNYIKY
jgi:hypothetical protein